MVNDAKIGLSKEECCCGITEFYDRIALRMGYDPQRTQYNCMRIRVTKAIQDEIYEHYRSEVKCSKLAISHIWLLCGPKADLMEEGYWAVIEPGFFCVRREV